MYFLCIDIEGIVCKSWWAEASLWSEEVWRTARGEKKTKKRMLNQSVQQLCGRLDAEL